VLTDHQCETIKSSYQTTTDLETQLTLAESNLKLALANNEMLEDALKSSSLSKDVGWRRSSRDTNSMQAVTSPVPVTPATLAASQSQTTSIDESEAQGALDSPCSDRDHSSAPSPAATLQPDSRFFRFRFTGSGRSTPAQPPNSPPPRPASRAQRTSHPSVGHLTSASLPSLVAPRPVTDELEELRGQLSVEKRKSEKITREKSELESELENLSQALFEEVRDFPERFPWFRSAADLVVHGHDQANKMVKVERIKRAEAEDELKDVHAEKEALKSALRLIEEDRMRAESVHRPHVNGIKASHPTVAPTHSRTSSREAVVSPRPRASDSPTPPSSPPPTAQSQSQSPTHMTISTAAQDSDDVPSSPAPPSPAPLYVPPPHLADSAPTSRTGSPMPLPHPHRLSHLRPAAPPPAPPPPSAADGFPVSPWAYPPLGADGAEEDAEKRLSVPQIVTFGSPTGEGEIAVPWTKETLDWRSELLSRHSLAEK